MKSKTKTTQEKFFELLRLTGTEKSSTAMEKDDDSDLSDEIDNLDYRMPDEDLPLIDTCPFYRD